VTMGLHEDLNEAWLMALNGMLDWMHTLYGYSRKEALAYASLVAHLRITQVVNGVKGVHCLLPYDALPPRAM
jgi:acetamidase/formamidase